jgi:parvulin-like peptidyl-prolyl isomerase
MQKLLKILVQKLPMDKNGDLIFDVDEARDIHNTAVAMLRRAVGVDVITTFADVESIDISDKNTTASVDDLEKVERSVYNAMGVSRNLFNADGNIALANSILDDESTMRNLLLQFDVFLDKIVEKKSGNKKFNFRLYMLETTQYNYRDLSKYYKELTANGQSKFMPMIALGHS